MGALILLKNFFFFLSIYLYGDVSSQRANLAVNSGKAGAVYSTDPGIF